MTTTTPPKECAARIRGLDCKNQRYKHSLFCKHHAHASNRIVLFSAPTPELLAYMMHRDGEQQ